MDGYGSGPPPQLQCADYRVGWVCALSLELVAATSMLDVEHGMPSDFIWQPKFDHNQYFFGQIGSHNVVLVVLPEGVSGLTHAALATKLMANAFPSLGFALMVGIAGGVPSTTNDIRLGDVVVSTPVPGHPGVLQYDFGKTGPDGEFATTRALNRPPLEALTAISAMKRRYYMKRSVLTNLMSDILLKNPVMSEEFSHQGVDSDVLFRADHDHVAGSDCANCNRVMAMVRPPRPTSEPRIHYGLIGSGNQVIKNGRFRDRLREKHGILCFEMEGAGAVEAFPSLVIRGICDYADSHKNDLWQGYAALTAAAYARDLLLLMGPPPMPASPPPYVAEASYVTAHVRMASPPRRGNPEARPPSRSPPVPEIPSMQQPIGSQVQGKDAKVQLYSENRPVADEKFLPQTTEPQPQRDDEKAQYHLKNPSVPDERPANQTRNPRPQRNSSSPRQPVPNPPPNHRQTDPQVRADYGRRLLQAAKAGNMPVVKRFLDRGGDPNMTTEDWNLTALHYTAGTGHNGTTQLLLKAGANPNAQAKFTKITPLFEAASNGHVKVIQCLLQHGAEIMKRCKWDRTALHAAAEKGHMACVEILVRNRADQDSTDSNGYTPLDLAKKEGHLDIVRYLQQI